jgi:CheY-like chemotaxis protein
MKTIRALVVDDEPGICRGIARCRAAGPVTIEWEQATTAKQALDRLTQPFDLLLVDMCLGNKGDRDGLVVAFFAKQHLVPNVFLWTGHQIQGDAQLELHALGIWSFTKAVDSERMIARLASVAAAEKPRSLSPETTLEQIARLMRLIDGRISDVAKQALAVAAEQALAETGNKVQAATLLGEERKFIDRAMAWKRTA